MLVIALAVRQRASGYTYLPGETQTAQSIIAANQATQQRDADQQYRLLELATSYQENKNNAATSLALATLSAKTEEDLATIQAGVSRDLANIASSTYIQGTQLQTQAAQNIATTQKQAATQTSFWGFLGNLLGGIASILRLGSGGGGGANPTSHPEPSQ